MYMCGVAVFYLRFVSGYEVKFTHGENSVTICNNTGETFVSFEFLDEIVLLSLMEMENVKEYGSKRAEFTPAFLNCR